MYPMNQMITADMASHSVIRSVHPMDVMKRQVFGVLEYADHLPILTLQ